MSNAERCVHAVDGPDWEGLRMFDTSGKDNYTALIEEARRIADEEPKGAGTLRVLAEAVESLLADNERLYREREAAEHSFEHSRKLHNKTKAERDALREQLDAMTVEWSAPDTGSILTAPFPVGYGTDEEMARRSAAVLHGPVYRRLVSEWTVVEGEKSNDNE